MWAIVGAAATTSAVARNATAPRASPPGDVAVERLEMQVFVCRETLSVRGSALRVSLLFTQLAQV